MSENERIERMSRQLGAVMEYRIRVMLLQKALRNMDAHLRNIQSTDTEFTMAMDVLAAILPSKVEKAEAYINEHRTKVDAAVNRLMDEL